MDKIKQTICLLTAMFLVAFIVMSVYGAFIGADSAWVFFNSPPLAVFWCLLTGFFLVGFVGFSVLRRRLGLLMIHFGCVLVLIGGLWGSRTVHQLRGGLGQPKLYKGTMPLRPGSQANGVYDALNPNTTFELPFIVRLNAFDIHYYDSPGWVVYHRATGRAFLLESVGGPVFDLPEDIAKVSLIKEFRSLRIVIGDDGVSGVENPDGPVNPGWLFEVMTPDGLKESHYVFESMLGHPNRDKQFFIEYRQPMMPKDYIADLEILINGKSVKQKKVEVNKPLHYGGYHIYQSSYNRDQGGLYSVLSIVSDSGLWFVYVGYSLMSIGCAWHFWFRRKGAGGGN